MEQIKRAEEIAREAHKGQTRWDGREYITHPQRVASSLDGIGLKVVAWLHDVIEDTNVTAKQLLKRGINVNLIQSIETLTRLDGENYFMFIMRIRYDEIATKVKIADLEDNIADGLKEGSLKDKYRLARYILLNTDL